MDLAYILKFTSLFRGPADLMDEELRLLMKIQIEDMMK